MSLRSSVLFLFLIVMAFLVPALAGATVVRRGTLEQLVEGSELVLHGMIRHVDDDLEDTTDGPFKTAVEIEIFEGLKGERIVGDTLRLVLPGGIGRGKIMQVPGLPLFRSGDEVVLLLEKTPGGGLTLTGLSQGVYRVDRAGDVARAIQSFEGLVFVGADGRVDHRAHRSAGFTLPQLLSRIRALSERAGGER